MKTRNIIMIVVLVTLFVVAGVLVVVGVVTHSEPGLIGACWDGDSIVRYEVDGADQCAELKWPEDYVLPLTVGVSARGAEPDPDTWHEVSVVVSSINQRLGFEMLALDPEDAGFCLEGHAICIEPHVPYERGFMDHNGSAEHFKAPTGMYCVARTSNTGTDELFGMVLEHELYHCLGLAHDDFDSSIMRPQQRPTPDGQLPPRLTDSDRELLWQLYHGSP
jgi:hypothetical protein